MAFCLARTCIWQQEARKTMQSHVYVHEVALFKINKKTDACQNVLWSFFHLETNVKNTHNDKRKIFYIFDNMLIYLLKNDTYYLEFRNNEVEIRPIQNVQHGAMHLYSEMIHDFFLITYDWKVIRYIKNFTKHIHWKSLTAQTFEDDLNVCVSLKSFWIDPFTITVVLLSCRANWYTWPKY